MNATTINPELQTFGHNLGLEIEEFPAKGLCTVRSAKPISKEIAEKIGKKSGRKILSKETHCLYLIKGQD